MTVQCIDCTFWQPKKGDPKLVRQGFAPCAHLPTTGVSFSATYRRQCPMYRAAEAAATEQRRAYLNRVQPSPTHDR